MCVRLVGQAVLLVLVANVKLREVCKLADDYFSPASILLISLAIIFSVCIISFLNRSLMTISIIQRSRISSANGNFRVMSGSIRKSVFLSIFLLKMLLLTCDEIVALIV